MSKKLGIEEQSCQMDANCLAAFIFVPAPMRHNFLILQIGFSMYTYSLSVTYDPGHAVNERFSLHVDENRTENVLTSEYSNELLGLG